MTKTGWMIECYEKLGDELVKEVALRDVDIVVLRQVFGESQDSPMVHCYPVGKGEEAKLRQLGLLVDELDTDQYECFLSCYQDAEDG